MPSSTVDPLSLVIRFNHALNARDLEAMMRSMTDDCVFENTYPPPDGERYEGQAAVRAFWDDFFRSSTEAQIEIEEIFAAADRVVMRWRYQWVEAGGKQGHIRGVDVYAIRGGLIAEKLSYVKG
jgi:ketosteroid isomerase-like protein